MKSIPITSSRERRKFDIAAFNGGEGRIAKAQAQAKKDGRNPKKWDDVKNYLKAAGANPAKVKEIQNYVDLVLEYLKEFLEKSKADRNIKKKDQPTNLHLTMGAGLLRMIGVFLSRIDIVRVKCFQIFFTGLLVSTFSFGEDTQCRFDYFAFDVDNLKCLKHHEAVKSIKKNLRDVKNLKKTCSKCEEPFSDAYKHLRLYGKKYLALNIEEHGFGGYTLYVLFDKESHAHKLWVYPIDKNVFQIRDIQILNIPKKATLEMLGFAKESKYAKYWVE